MRLLFDWPPVWTGMFLVVIWWLSRALPVPVFGVAGDVGGGLLVLAGLGFMALAVWEMGRLRTTIIPRRTAHALVTSGVFRISRNPIYLGDALVLMGACLILDSLLGILLLPLFVWAINTRFIEGEEAHLQQAFGADFTEWSGQVRRWL
ncbi:isoprenylcysteine carboxylmethyltransferase family protein [Pseudorhodobacter sp. W20_MBD10_FR17]|uniref:methyltransferase family protein n=1 Tax=Pseudorhodobacter sp. W20_MBD10_FR17 TaxID=3240266 RepID=UPI003F94FC3E